MKTLADLLAGFPPAKVKAVLGSYGASQEVAGVTSDSRQVKASGIFVAVKGAAQDGHRFIPQVAQHGPALIVGEDPPPKNLGARYLQVEDSRLALARLAANFYEHPTRDMLVIGVTGTSGKTTVTYLLESMLLAAGKRVGVIGTVNFRFDGKAIDSTHTTPGAVELQALIRLMSNAGCNVLVMEVSSHALKQHRAAFVAFDAMIFTNLSSEHMDFHPDMEDYYQSKKMLFRELVQVAIEADKEPFAAINVDDSYGRRLFNELMDEAPAKLGFKGYGLSRMAEITGAGLNISLSGIRGEAHGLHLESPLTGRFNAFNVLAAVTAAQGLGVRTSAIVQGLKDLKFVPGRLQRVPNDRGLRIFVDYAHKPDALENVLKTLKEMISASAAVSGAKPRLITVFGCGGDRDRQKRPVMGKIAVELSDQVYITSDNPRTEDPKAIISEILAGIAGQETRVAVEPDRRKAIFVAISTAKEGDLVLIAGKGHEDYQIIGTQKIHFDDREVVAEALNSLNQVP